MAGTPLKKNDVVGCWRLEKLLGEGGQGVVWQARHSDETHCPAVAIKICTSFSEKARTRFRREVELLRDQDHPGIVRVRDSGEDGGLLYLVMEIASLTLADISRGAIEQSGRHDRAKLAYARLIAESPELLLRFIRQACEGVCYLHDRDVLHRDIKPSNILLMLDPREPLRAAVADFGIGTTEDQQGELTATHETVGTAGFRAPETARGKHSQQSDVYSLGKAIEATFNRTHPVEVGPAKLRRDYSRGTSELWDALDAVIAGACAVSLVDRYPNVRALLDALPSAVVGLAPGRVVVPGGIRAASNLVTASIGRGAEQIEGVSGVGAGIEPRYVNRGYSLGILGLEFANAERAERRKQMKAALELGLKTERARSALAMLGAGIEGELKRIAAGRGVPRIYMHSMLLSTVHETLPPDVATQITAVLSMRDRLQQDERALSPLEEPSAREAGRVALEYLMTRLELPVHVVGKGIPAYRDQRGLEPQAFELVHLRLFTGEEIFAPIDKALQFDELTLNWDDSRHADASFVRRPDSGLLVKAWESSSMFAGLPTIML